MAISPQLAWQRKMRQQGRCRICGKPARANKSKCELHAQRDRDRYQKKSKFPIDSAG